MQFRNIIQSVHMRLQLMWIESVLCPFYRNSTTIYGAHVKVIPRLGVSYSNVNKHLDIESTNQAHFLIRCLPARVINRRTGLKGDLFVIFSKTTNCKSHNFSSRFFEIYKVERTGILVPLLPRYKHIISRRDSH